MAATLRQRIDQVRHVIATAANKSGRDPAAVTLVAVSKTVDRPMIDAAYQLGLRHFGENRVQDAVNRFDPPLPPDAELHMIGQLQTNKVRLGLSVFTMIESVDRPSLIQALDKEAARVGRRLPVLIQVNVAGEDQKAGCAPEQVSGLIQLVQESAWLDLRGLMTIGPLVDEPEAIRPVFAGLRSLRDQVRDNDGSPSLDVLSMGMTNDYAIAIEEGATEVRVGRAIFQP